MNINLLVLDIGLYDGEDALRTALSEHEAQQTTIVNLKYPKDLQNRDWDDLIEQLRCSQRCITL